MENSNPIHRTYTPVVDITTRVGAYGALAAGAAKLAGRYAVALPLTVPQTAIAAAAAGATVSAVQHLIALAKPEIHENPWARIAVAAAVLGSVAIFSTTPTGAALIGRTGLFITSDFASKLAVASVIAEVVHAAAFTFISNKNKADKELAEEQMKDLKKTLEELPKNEEKPEVRANAQKQVFERIAKHGLIAKMSKEDMKNTPQEFIDYIAENFAKHFQGFEADVRSALDKRLKAKIDDKLASSEEAVKNVSALNLVRTFENPARLQSATQEIRDAYHKEFVKLALISEKAPQTVEAVEALTDLEAAYLATRKDQIFAELKDSKFDAVREKLEEKLPKTATSPNFAMRGYKATRDAVCKVASKTMASGKAFYNDPKQKAKAAFTAAKGYLPEASKKNAKIAGAVAAVAVSGGAIYYVGPSSIPLVGRLFNNVTAA